MEAARAAVAAQQEALRRQRREFLEKLLGGRDPLTWQKPPAEVDFDALLHC